MIGQDLHNRLDFIKVLAPIAGGGDTPLVGAVIDHSVYMGFEYAIMSGILADAGATWTVLLEEDDDVAMGTAAAVADADMLPSGTGQEAAASLTQANDGVVRTLGYIGIKRYTRMTITPSGNAGSDPLAVLGIGIKRLRGEVNGS